MFLLNSRWKSYMWKSNGTIGFDFGCTCNVKIRKGANLFHILQLNTNRNSYIRSPMTPLHLTVDDLKGESHLDL